MKTHKIKRIEVGKLCNQGKLDNSKTFEKKINHRFLFVIKLALLTISTSKMSTIIFKTPNDLKHKVDSLLFLSESYLVQIL